MPKRKWLGFTDAGEDAIDLAPVVEITRATTDGERKALADTDRTVLRLHYKVGGAWRSDAGEFQQFEVPDTATTELEGAPAVPKDGLFVAVPEGATDIRVTVVDRSMVPVDEEVFLAPAPQQFVEAEFREVREPDPDYYESDQPFPGDVFEYLGLKAVSGVQVAHILVYLGQYRAQSKRLDLVQSLTLEISYQLSGTDALPSLPPEDFAERDLILGLELLAEDADGEPAPSADDSGMDDGDGEGGAPQQGISWLDRTEDDGVDPSFAGPVQPSAPMATATFPATAIALRMPKVRIRNLVCEYAIVTTPALSDSVQPLLAAKTGWPHYGRVVLTTDIQEEFPTASLKESIRGFIQWAHQNWRVPPRFVVLAGDTDVIPIHTYNRGGNQYASDHYYQDISGDLAPELTVSRIPTSNATQMRQVCRHLASYSRKRGGDWGGWQARVMLCAYQSATYEDTCDAIHKKIKNRYRSIKRYAKNTNRSQVVKTMNDGVVIALYRGHGGKTSWSSSNGLRVSDVGSLTNAGHPPFVLSVCCQNGWIDDNATETIAEAFIRRRKSVAVFASSRNSWTYPNNDFAKYMFDAIMKGHSYTPARIISYAKTKMVQKHGNSSHHMDNTVMYNLLGDPTAHVASNVEWLRGNWAMDHDGWKGVLKITRIWRYRVEKHDGQAAPVWSISGDYVAHDNTTRSFIGTVGGFDSYHSGPGKRRSDHRLEFRIKFSGSNNQRFVGYVHTWSRRVISGITWWSGRPFGWTAHI